VWCVFQSDIVHQSVYELVHSEDREELQRQLLWNSFLPTDGSAAGLSLQDALRRENEHLLERSFTVRFRCLLDNTSGFLVSLSLSLHPFLVSLSLSLHPFFSAGALFPRGSRSRAFKLGAGLTAATQTMS